MHRHRAGAWTCVRPSPVCRSRASHRPWRLRHFVSRYFAPAAGIDEDLVYQLRPPRADPVLGRNGWAGIACTRNSLEAPRQSRYVSMARACASPAMPCRISKGGSRCRRLRRFNALLARFWVRWSCCRPASIRRFSGPERHRPLGAAGGCPVRPSQRRRCRREGRAGAGLLDFADIQPVHANRFQVPLDRNRVVQGFIPAPVADPGP